MLLTNLSSTYFIHPSKFIQPCKSVVVVEQVFCHAPNLREASMTGSKSVHILVAAVKVKAKKAHLSYIEKCCIMSYYYILNFLLTQCGKCE